MARVFTQEDSQLKDIEQFKQNLDAVPAIDLIPVYSSQLEREIFNLFFISLTDLTPKYIEKTIQTVYIFDRAESKIMPQEKEGKISAFLEGFILLFHEYKHIGSTMYKIYVATEGKDKLAASEIRLKYFTPDENMSAEIKRLKLVTEINKIVDKKYTIPSHSIIKSSLLNLAAHRYLDIKKTGTKILWHINPEFYQRWQERHNQLMDEFEKYRKESKEQSSVDRDADAMISMFNKYHPIVLEFYDIAYWRVLKGSEKNKGFERPISLIYRYFDDISILTRY